MRKALIAVGVLAVAYYLYKMYNKKQESPIDPPTVEGGAVALAIEEAKKPKPRRKTIIEDNRDVFRSMKGNFNSEESATVAPSINAKIGIF